MKVIWIQVFILALPVFLITAGLCAWTVKLLDGDIEDLTWYGAWTLGVLVSITDPTEPIETLKEIHANHKFITLLEFESLINDGAGIMFWGFFSSLAAEGSGESLTVKYFTKNIIYAGAAALVFGYLFRLICEKWLKIVHGDVINTINITVVGSYLVYCIGNFSVLKLSGILALIVFGLGLSSVSKTHIQQKAMQSLHGFWQYMLSVSNTFIYLMAGLHIGIQLKHSTNILTWEHAWKALVFFLATVFARFIAVGLFYPVLAKTGYGMTFKRYCILSYSGYKGSHGLFLAVVMKNGEFPEELKQIIVFYVGVTGIASLLF